MPDIPLMFPPILDIPPPSPIDRIQADGLGWRFTVSCSAADPDSFVMSVVFDALSFNNEFDPVIEVGSAANIFPEDA